MNTLLISLAIFLAVCISVIFYFISIYNGLVRLRREADRSWSNIDVLLKQRHDEVPKLVEVCKGYMQHERETLEKVIEARNAALSRSGSMAEKASAEGSLSRSLMSLFALVENYPELKANNSFGSLQRRISAIEDQIADRREFYNASATNFNTRIEEIPDLFLARPMGYTPRELYVAHESEKQDVEISFRK